MRISEVAAESGCHLETIRYYERIGVTPRPERRDNGYRNYNGDDLRRLRFIGRARDLGFSLAEIKSLLRLDGAPGDGCVEVDAIARSHLAEIRSRIRDLDRVAAELERIIANCSGNACEHCAILDALREN